MVEEAGQKQTRTCAEIFLEEWGCSGRKRPTLADLLDLLKEAELFNAADYLAVDLLEGLVLFYNYFSSFGITYCLEFTPN